MPLLVPLIAKASSVNSYRSVLIRTQGYGVDISRAQNTLPTTYRDPTAGVETPFTGMSEKLSSKSWSALEEELKGSSATLVGSPLDLSLLPPDWRALAGMQGLWLTPEEYVGLDAGQQAAIRNWVGYGGSLFVCETAPDQPTRTEFGLRDPAGNSAAFGYGSVQWVAYDGKQLPAHDTVARINAVHRPDGDAGFAEAKDWPLVKAIGTLTLNAPFLIIFIAAFALLIGPINLFAFARAGQRHRLFWTTPLISLTASLLLIVIIVLEDGLGGNGSRVVLTYLLPAQNEAVVMQEQASRTGVLLSRGFTSRDDLFLVPVDLKKAGGQEYEQNGKSYGGDWYASRSLQAQRAKTIVPTRARVDLLNAEQATAGAPPVVVSSLPVELTELRYTDEAGKFWRGQHLRTGERQTLQPDEGSSVVNSTGGSDYLERLLKDGRTRRGNFTALAAKGQFIETLPSIRWTDERAIILGPVTNNH